MLINNLFGMGAKNIKTMAMEDIKTSVLKTDELVATHPHIRLPKTVANPIPLNIKCA